MSPQGHFSSLVPRQFVIRPSLSNRSVDRSPQRREVEIFEGRLTRDEVRRKAECSSPSDFVNRSFVLHHSPGAAQQKGCSKDGKSIFSLCQSALVLRTSSLFRGRSCGRGCLGARFSKDDRRRKAASSSPSSFVNRTSSFVNPLSPLPSGYWAGCRTPQGKKRKNEKGS
jgi:hypothetical protein